MGYSTLYDIIGSIFIAGILFVMVVRTNGNMTQTTYTDAQDYLVQANMSNFVRIIERDMRRIGYCANPDSFPRCNEPFLAAGPHNMTFLADLNDDSKMDTIAYSVLDSTKLLWTPNRHDFPFIRTVRSAASALRRTDTLFLGLVQFDLQFYKTDGTIYPFNQMVVDSLGGLALTGIFPVQITIMLQNPFGYQNTPDSTKDYTYVYWRQLRLTARNLYNR